MLSYLVSGGDPVPATYLYGGITYTLTGPGGQNHWIEETGAVCGWGWTQWDSGWVYGGQCDVWHSDVSPLAVNMDDLPIRMSTPFNATPFDLTGNGTPQRYSWPKTRQTAWIAYDRDGTGRIRNINDLFGNNTVGPDGKKAPNGFDALKKYDANHDGFIDEKDPIYDRLVLWFDRNHDGRSTPREIMTLRQAHIKALDLHYIDKVELNDRYGNQSRERSVINHGRR